ncbi:MAG TPA: IS1595 family transposase [Rhodospirillaceae bacterium]|nr:IS1595 family transposase [Magnetovibrio sp.]HCS68921.1 IS1595 family transposase [Rhodospirillaceae bacterium]|tara:strand:+ start:748 stop:1668 length:921 start_codon:yes stop_codon:yes gene_type:complete
MNNLSNPIFQNETKAREWLEARCWPNGPVCPHCGEQEYTKMEGDAHRPGLYQCNACRKQFTVTVGTVMERSKIALTKWLMAMYLLSASKKGMSANQLSRMLGLPYKTAWFMTHRIREAMKDDNPTPLGGGGSVVEADETYFGKKPGRSKRRGDRGPVSQRAVVALVERGGSSRALHVRDYPHAAMVRDILVKNVRRDSELNTDESRLYTTVGKEYAGHYTVTHSEYQYVHPQTGAHSNTIEGYLSIFKRGMKGVYQHCAEKHLQAYLNEFDFRYNTRKITDMERAELAAAGIVGKRLTYRRTGAQA